MKTTEARELAAETAARAAAAADAERARQQHHEWLALRARERETEQAAHAARLALVNDHRLKAGYSPIKDFSAWHSVSDDELRRLLWSMPTVHVARQFDVSDVAVHKAARSRHIANPPRGFWAKVAAGKLPHPRGEPQP
ncbi:hypothetical protein ETR14_27535 (plasmid) [Sphingosinicella sp. BN140058]|nr:hypothetical protein ETR14_27535 [Sphingosinicella sp. BN140058]